MKAPAICERSVVRSSVIRLRGGRRSHRRPGSQTGGRPPTDEGIRPLDTNPKNSTKHKRQTAGPQEGRWHQLSLQVAAFAMINRLDGPLSSQHDLVMGLLRPRADHQAAGAYRRRRPDRLLARSVAESDNHDQAPSECNSRAFGLHQAPVAMTPSGPSGCFLRPQRSARPSRISPVLRRTLHADRSKGRESRARESL